MKPMKLYLMLACLGFANDGVLTAYYTYADRGHVWSCVGLCALQQCLAMFQAYYSFVDCEMGSREQIKRWVAEAVGYCLAAYLTVGWLN